MDIPIIHPSATGAAGAIPGSEPDAVAASWPLRAAICAMTIGMCVICYADRAALSVAMARIGGDFGLTAVATGWILSSFMWSYVAFNLPSAMLLDRFGPRVTGALAVALWSIAMVLGGLAPTVAAFIATRVLLGIGEAPTFSLGSKVIRVWAPRGARGLTMTAFVAGIAVGLGVGALACAWLVDRCGWRCAFAVLGGLGLLWSALWVPLYPAAPRRRASAPPRTSAARLSLARLARSADFWGVVTAQCCANYANFLLMSWLPIILRQTFHLSLLASGLDTACAYLGAAVLALLLGRAGDRVVAGAGRPPAGRRTMVMAFLIGVALLGLLPFAHAPAAAIGLLVVCIACGTAATGANMALLADLLAERDALGSVTGVMLTFSNGTAIAAPVITGYLLQATGNFHAVFVLAALIALAGAVVVRRVPQRPIHATAGAPR